MTGTIGCIGLVAIAGFIGFLFYRRKKLMDDLQNFYKEGNYTNRAGTPVPHPFVHEMSYIVNSDGSLKPGVPYTLMLGTQFSGAGQSRRQDDYIGFYFPPQVQLSDAWLNAWQDKVAERGDGWAKHSNREPLKKSWGLMGPPQTLPIRAARMEDGGVVLAWSGLHLRKVIEARIADVLATL
jgi:hypothetical protein